MNGGLRITVCQRRLANGEWERPEVPAALRAAGHQVLEIGDAPLDWTGDDLRWTNHAILYERCTPVFADVHGDTGNLDVSSVASKIGDRTRAILAVHYAGYPCDLDELYALARARGLAVIEDCAHACGAVYRGARVGSHGALHAFSFHAVKNLAMGDGGALRHEGAGFLHLGLHRAEHADFGRRRAVGVAHAGLLEGGICPRLSISGGRRGRGRAARSGLRARSFRRSGPSSGTPSAAAHPRSPCMA